MFTPIVTRGGGADLHHVTDRRDALLAGGDENSPDVYVEELAPGDGHHCTVIRG